MCSRSLEISTQWAAMIVRYGDRTSVVVSILALTSASIGASSASAASWSLLDLSFGVWRASYRGYLLSRIKRHDF
jgi:hypothetical protein